MWSHFDNFLKAKFQELDDYSYPREPDIKSCINDAIFAFDLGNTQRSLSIIDIGLKSLKTEKSRELLARLKADIEARTLG